LKYLKKEHIGIPKEICHAKTANWKKPEAIHQSLSFFSIYIFMKEAVYAISHGKRGTKKGEMVKN
jgi:hypothetical protein